MPLLDKDSLIAMRQLQLTAAMSDRRCVKCQAQLWPMYCRECDEHFTDGHYRGCEDATRHQDHRRY